MHGSNRMDTTVAGDPDKFLRAVADADVLVGWRFPHRELALHARRLKWIHLTGAGIEHVMPVTMDGVGGTMTGGQTQPSSPWWRSVTPISWASTPAG